MADAGNLPAVGAYEHDLAGIEGCRKLNLLAFLILPLGALKAGADVNTLDCQKPGLAVYSNNLACLGAVLASHHLDRVTFFQINGNHML